MRNVGGNKMGLITYPENGREVLLKSRVRENLKSSSVRWKGDHSSFREEVAMCSTRQKIEIINTNANNFLEYGVCGYKSINMDFHPHNFCNMGY